FARPEVQWVLELASTKLNGTWFSFDAQGQCRPGERPTGDGRCFWRLAETRATINATCINDRLKQLALNRNPSCFADCTPFHPSTSWNSLCYVSCLFEAFNGNASATLPVAGVTTQELEQLFEEAFKVGKPGSCPRRGELEVIDIVV
ncbi:unnamed protein product, partial [Polarella glacialis]